jgi:signal transduction histidine kinase
MHLSFRSKLAIVVIAPLLAFLASSLVVHRQSVLLEQRISSVRDHYIPLVELSYKLDGEFESIGTFLQNSVSSQDVETIGNIEAIQRQLFSDLDSAVSILGQKAVSDLKLEIGIYVTMAFDTSRRLIAGESGPQITDLIARMQKQRAIAQDLLKTNTRFDRSKISNAFATISSTQEKGRKITLFVNSAVAILTILLSLVIGRDLMAGLGEIANGLTRFGDGDYTTRINIVGTDELSELSRQANSMADRTQGLMQELESFSYSVAHDLRAPLRSIMGFSNVLIEDHSGSLNDDAKESLARITGAASRMGHMVDSLLSISRLNRKKIIKQKVDLSTIADRTIKDFCLADPQRKLAVVVQKNLLATGDEQLLDVALTNLISNAWKFTKSKPEARIEIGVRQIDRQQAFFVKDNGAGFDMRYADKLFGAFQRLHSEKDFEGHGIGLATVKSIINKHGGTIWAEGEVNKGAVFYFTLC